MVPMHTLFYAQHVKNHSPYHPLKNDLSDVFDLLVCFLIDVSEAGPVTTNLRYLQSYQHLCDTILRR